METRNDPAELTARNLAFTRLGIRDPDLFGLATRSLEGIVLDRLFRTSLACPAQWDAWVQEHYLYIRYRGGWFTVDVNAETGDDELHEDGTVLCYASDDPLDGWMSTMEMLQLTGLSLAEAATYEDGDAGDPELVAEFRALGRIRTAPDRAWCPVAPGLELPPAWRARRDANLAARKSRLMVWKQGEQHG